MLLKANSGKNTYLPDAVDQLADGAGRIYTKTEHELNYQGLNYSDELTQVHFHVPATATPCRSSLAGLSRCRRVTECACTAACSIR